MNKLTKVKFKFSSIAMIGLLGVVGCSDEKLLPLGTFSPNEFTQFAQSTADFCTTPAREAQSKLKFIFLLDKSGSNRGTTGVPGTDPKGRFRYDSISEFMQSAPVDDPTISYSLVNFSDPSSVAWGPQGADIIFADRLNFINHIQDQKYAEEPQNGCTRTSQDGCPFDQGWTDYLDSLQRVRGIIQDDINDAKVVAENTGVINSSYYVIFMLTDGAPIVGNSGGVDIRQDTNCFQTVGGVRVAQDCTIFQSVEGLVNLSQGNNRDFVDAVQVHTLFYYSGATADQSAVQLLDIMAKNYGNGNSISVSTGEEIDFSLFAVPIRRVRHSVKDAFLVNMNAIWWQGTLMKDSDADGLPDNIEIQLGSNPNKYDSDENGVGDGIEYKVLNLKPCGDAQCRPWSTAVPNAERFPSCTAFIQVGAPADQKYKDSDKDFLNDCEEQLLASERFVWDTNRNWIPDDIEVRFGLNYTAGTNDKSLDPDGDGSSNYDEIKFFTPVFYPNNLIPGLKKFVYNMVQTSIDDRVACVRLKTDDIPLLTSNDLIRIYFVEGTSFIDDNRFLRVVEKRVGSNGPDSNVVTFEKGDFK